jgi:hypothetical protein
MLIKIFKTYANGVKMNGFCDGKKKLNKFRVLKIIVNDFDDVR